MNSLTAVLGDLAASFKHDFNLVEKYCDEMIFLCKKRINNKDCVMSFRGLLPMANILNQFEYDMI